MYITIRKYRLKERYQEVRDAVTAGLVPILQSSPGFQGYWALQCDDGDIAGISLFDTEENALAATERTREWVSAHIREHVVLPPEAMFGGAVEKLA